MREVAANFLANSDRKELEILNSLFEVAIAQNWVSPYELSDIKNDYANLVSSLAVAEGNPQQPEQSVVFASQKEEIGIKSQNGLSERHEKILCFLRENGRAQVWQIKQVLPEVTKRTLRRDFESLLSQGIIERMGERNDTFYQLKRESV